MKIALAGKGGAGKTTISATLARILAREGTTVLAVDADSNPNLGTALGVESAALTTAPALPVSLVSRRLDGSALTAPVEEVVRNHGVPAPDGVRLVSMGAPGHAGEGCLCSEHATVNALLADIEPAASTAAVVDMEASPEQLSRGTVEHAEVLLLVAEPYFRSLETTRRLAGLAADLSIPHVGVVANKLRSAEDSAALREFCERHELTCWGELPYSDDVVAADRATRPLLDAHPDGAIVTAIAGIAARLRELEAATSRA